MASKLLVLDNVEPPIILLTAGLANTVHDLGFEADVVITHGHDGVHSDHSLHYEYAALDVRTHNLSIADRSKLFYALKAKFPTPKYDIILEDPNGPNQHIHMEKNHALSEGQKE